MFPRRRAEFHPKIQAGLRATAADVLANVGDSGCQLIDARDAGQFTGAKRRGMRGGRIPGAIHLPRELFFGEGGGFLPLEEIRKRVVSHGFEFQKPAIGYCNGGVAATVVLFNLFRLGHDRLTNYDGSWNEWGNHPDWPAEV